VRGDRRERASKASPECLKSRFHCTVFPERTG
jgi:hypothetical protein